ncbi:ABC transporter permease [Caballeronia mineralivorans]|jgi:putative spermidine/putrescine transport system permease protein|uniref:ABC transporter permease n=1 Tax=Caballeronia mineralivorans TaxID=2010198 RepID=UPI000F0DA388|nr:ABC transporter permease subunit [Caballeronia mineralivorans]MEA3096242.1 putative spermidine/putrescine transport system permease protein [Caballeronia mineralivorans]
MANVAAARGARAAGMSFRMIMSLVGGVGVLLLMLPTLIVLVTSFTSGYSLKFPPPGFSLRWYEALVFDSPEIIDALTLSLKLAALATAIATVLAVGAAVALARRRSLAARVLDSFFMAPLTVPSLALGLGILVLFNLESAGLSFYSLLAGHIALCAPYILYTTSASYAQLDPALLDSSLCLGASPMRTFRRVVLPALWPGIASGAFIAFMNSFDNVALSLFLSDARSEVLPIRLWHIIEDSLDVRAAAVSGVLILVTLVSMLIMERVAGLSRQFR